MDTSILDHLGKKYRLTKILPHLRNQHHLNLNGFSAEKLTLLFRHASLPNAGRWQDLWNELKPMGARPIDDVSEIKEELIELIKDDVIRITLDEDSSNQTSKAGPGVGGETAQLGPQVNDKPPHAFKIEGGDTKPSEKNAVKNDGLALKQQKSEETKSQGVQSISNTKCNADPVSMVTGEELLQFEDASLHGPVPFSWLRTYRSSNPHDRGMGYGWSHSASEKLELSNTVITYCDTEGREIPFNVPRVNQRSKYLPEGLILDRVSENGFVLKQEGQFDKVFTRSNTAVRTFLLTQIRHPAYVPGTVSLGVKQPEKGYVINVIYNNDHRVSRIAGNWGRSLCINRDSHGRVVEIELSNDELQLRKTVATYHYSSQGDLIAKQNARGVGEKYRYENHLIQQRTLTTGFNFYFEWDGTDSTARCIHSWGDRGIYEYYFDWDPKNNTSKTTDSRGYLSEYRYNEYGQIVKEVDNEGGEHLYSYIKGRKDSYVDPEGNKTEYFFDNENNPAGMRDALGNSLTLGYFNGRPTTFIDKDKTHWKREYDSKGQLISLVDPYNQTTRYTYNEFGLIASSVNPMGRKTLYRWSESGLLLSILDPMGHRRKFSYDTWGQITAVEFVINGKQSAGKTEFLYNETGFIEEVRAANGEVSHYKYNENDQLISYSDPQGRTTEFVYDGLSQVVERYDAEGHSLKYEYDSERNLTALINEKGERYQFFYDGCERLVKEIGFDGRVQHYKYNKVGHLIKHMDAGSVVTEFDRDALGQMTAKTSKSLKIGIKALERTRFQYDPKGRIIECYNASQYLTFEYNIFGSLVKEHHSDLNEKMNRVKSSMVDIQFANIWPGIRSGITLPDGQRIDYGFDNNNQLSNVVFNGDVISSISRDEFGREVSRNQGVLTTQSHYDPMGRLEKQQSYHREYKVQGPVQREYNYDKFGNLSRVLDGENETRYVYDMLNRLKRVEGGHPETFEFDPASNLLSQNRSDRGKSEGNRLAMQGDCKFTYDERGNLVQENRGKDGKLSTRFEYNLNNQLVKVDKGDQIVHYKYDPLGRRFEKRDDFGCTKYLWAGDQLTQETRKSVKKTYIYEPESFKPVVLVQDGEVYHYHTDHLGTPKELTNAFGKVVWKAQYKAYGNVAVKEVEEIENNLRFQGQYFDEETGLHYNRHRYYNPNTGQFITQDPIGLLGGVNNYRYAPNPVHWVDPFGLNVKKGDCPLGASNSVLKVGQIHPQTGNVILASKKVIVSQNTNADFIVEASKPSMKGKLIKEEIHYYENNGHHDPTVIIKTGGRNNNTDKGVLPPNHVELFNSSVLIDGNRFSVDSNNMVHQFQDSINKTFHWSGSQNDVNIKGESLAPIKVKREVLRELKKQGLLE